MFFLFCRLSPLHPLMGHFEPGRSTTDSVGTVINTDARGNSIGQHPEEGSSGHLDAHQSRGDGDVS